MRIRTETLLVKLPKALDMGNAVVGSRQFDLDIFTHVQNMYTRIRVGPVSIIPNFAPVHVWVFRNDVELGRYTSQNGKIEFQHESGMDSSLTLQLYNLSIDTSVMLSITIEGDLYNGIQG